MGAKEEFSDLCLELTHPWKKSGIGSTKRPGVEGTEEASAECPDHLSG